MPELNGVDAFKQIRKRDKNAKGIFLTMYEGEEYIYQTMRAGAKGMLSKNVVKGELILAIRKVYEGGKFFGKNYNPEKLKELDKKFKMISEENGSTDVELNNKEIKILEYLSKGKTSAEIGDLVNLSKKSIDYYRSKIMIKLGIKTLPELISFAIRYSNSNKLFDR
jgi:two-component system, NarL family, response regulator NreC